MLEELGKYLDFACLKIWHNTKIKDLEIKDSYPPSLHPPIDQIMKVQPAGEHKI